MLLLLYTMIRIHASLSNTVLLMCGLAHVTEASWVVLSKKIQSWRKWTAVFSSTFSFFSMHECIPGVIEQGEIGMRMVV